MHINIFFSQWWWQWQRSLDPLKASPTRDCQKALSVRKFKRIADGQSLPATHPSLGLLLVPSGAACCSKPPRPQCSFSTTLTRPQMHLEFGWWEHKCRQWRQLHSKTRLCSGGSGLTCRLKQGSKLGAWGSYLCNSMIASALRSHGGKGNSRKPFHETNKIMTVTGLSHPAKGERSNWMQRE